jgi:RNA polymerase sigma-70 factor (ECF subfamily)
MNDDQPGSPRPAGAPLDQAWRDHRRRLLDIAFRLLGNLGEAEDAVQEAFTRLVRADVDRIDDVAGWLVVVVSRLCLDRLRAERRHPTVAVASTEPFDSAPSVDPADRMTLDDDVRVALHMVLEQLSPAERTAFVLHDVFQYPFDAVAEIVGRTPAACRQLASRARKAIASDVGGPGRFHVASAEQWQVTEQFIKACSTGDLTGLLALLDPAVAGVADVGGTVGIITVTGPSAVAATAMRFLGPETGTTLLSLPGGDEASVVTISEGRAVAILTLCIRNGLVNHIDGIIDNEKLGPIAAALGL